MDRNAPRRPMPLRTAAVNDTTARDGMWRRFDGDDWAAFDALPRPVRARLQEHAYDAWAVNALILWRTFRRRHASSDRATTTLLRYLDHCEALERVAFADVYRRAHGTALPHVAAAASVLRYRAGPPGRDDRAQPARKPPSAQSTCPTT